MLKLQILQHSPNKRLSKWPWLHHTIHSFGLGFHCISAMACSSNGVLHHISGGPRSCSGSGSVVFVVLLYFVLSSLYRFLLSKSSARLAMIYLHVDSLFSFPLPFVIIVHLRSVFLLGLLDFVIWLHFRKEYESLGEKIWKSLD